MRMSSAVKEYIKEKIAEKYPLKEINQKPFDTEVIAKEIEEATTPIVREIFAKYADKVGFQKYMGNGVYRNATYDEVFLRGSYNYSGSKVDLVYEETKKYNKAIETKRAKVFRDIIVQMELGGTKKDLDELLANLPD